MNHIELIQENTKPLRNKIINHELYHYIETPDDLRLFTQHHVFAVWDFMSLVKALQQKFTCVNVPWTPKKVSSEYVYFINKIVLAKESNITWNGERQSHFEMYLEAMEDLGASTSEISRLLEQVQHGTDVFLVISASDLPKSVKTFLIFTFNTIYHQDTPELLSAFTFGREDLIPDKFPEIIGSIQEKFPQENISKLKYYFKKNKEIEADEYVEIALNLINDLCQDNDKKWLEIQKTAKKTLKKRLKLLDGIKNAILLSRAIT